MIKQFENNDILVELESFLKSRDSVFMDKRFDSLCKINNPFEFVENGNIEEIEKLQPDLISDLSWQDYVNKYGLNVQINSKTSINLIQKLDNAKYGEKEFDNVYWPSGNLGKQQFNIILDILKKHGDVNQIISYYYVLTNLHFDICKDELYLTDLLGFKELIEKKEYFTPTIWWDEGLNWLIYTDYDLTTSYIFGDSNLIKEVTNKKELESFKLNNDEYISDLNESSYKLIE